jgi:hypothetical protein
MIIPVLVIGVTLANDISFLSLMKNGGLLKFILTHGQERLFSFDFTYHSEEIKRKQCNNHIRTYNIENNYTPEDIILPHNCHKVDISQDRQIILTFVATVLDISFSDNLDEIFEQVDKMLKNDNLPFDKCEKVSKSISRPLIDMKYSYRRCSI